MIHLVYLTGLLLGIGGMLLIDRRWKLAFWSDQRQTIYVLGIGMFVFIAWDIIGILRGIFAHGNSPYALPFVIAPQFPVEELFFLFLFLYTTLIVYRGAAR